MNLNPEFLCHPTVFALGDTYQIITPVKSEMLFWVMVGDKKYCDHSNGILRSSTLVHKVVVPMKELNRAKKYTVCYQKIIDRKPYFPESEDTVETVYRFKPIKAGKPINLYHISDSHGKVEESVAAAKAAFGEDIDLLVLNGDISDHSSSVKNISMIYHIASAITGGTIPCVFSRGNHDMRGAFAEHLAEYTPTTPGDGLTYFTFRLGDLWGLVIDCAEDKLDSQVEYGGTICCHEYRQAETEFLKEVAKKKKYSSKTVKYKMVICHAPFTYRDRNDNGLFDIENDIYNEWVKILNDSIKPDFLLAGHKHVCAVSHPGDQYDDRGQAFPVIIGARPKAISNEPGYTGTAIRLENGGATAHFTDNTGTSVPAGEFKF